MVTLDLLLYNFNSHLIDVRSFVVYTKFVEVS